MAVSTVSWEELEDSPTIQATRSGDITCVRRIKTAWGDAITFMTELLTGGTNGYPQQFPGLTGVYVDAVSIDPFVKLPAGGAFTDPAVSIVTHTEAMLTVNYKFLITDSDFENPSQQDPSLPDGTFASYSREESTESITVPGRSLLWASDDEIVHPDAHATMLVPVTVHVVKWERVTSPPWSVISKTRGKVNSTEFRIPATGQRLSPETLLFNGATSEKQYSLASTTSWALTYRFMEKSIQNLSSAGEGAVREVPEPTTETDGAIGWNHAWRDSPAKWDKPYDNVSNDNLYKTAEFADLFQFA